MAILFDLNLVKSFKIIIVVVILYIINSIIIINTNVSIVISKTIVTIIISLIFSFNHWYHHLDKQPHQRYDMHVRNQLVIIIIIARAIIIGITNNNNTLIINVVIIIGIFGLVCFLNRRYFWSSYLTEVSSLVRD